MDDWICSQCGEWHSDHPSAQKTMPDISTLTEMIEMPQDVIERAISALEVALRETGSASLGEALGELQDAYEDATATEA